MMVVKISTIKIHIPRLTYEQENPRQVKDRKLPQDTSSKNSNVDS